MGHEIRINSTSVADKCLSKNNLRMNLRLLRKFWRLRRSEKSFSAAGASQVREDNRPIRATSCNVDVSARWSSDSTHILLLLTTKSFPLWILHVGLISTIVQIVEPWPSISGFENIAAQTDVAVRKVRTWTGSHWNLIKLNHSRVFLSCAWHKFEIDSDTLRKPQKYASSKKS